MQKRNPEEELTAVQKRTLQRVELDYLMSETDFCARQLVKPEPDPVKNQTHNPKPGNSTEALVEQEIFETLKGMDSCCKPWQNCGPVINGQ